eukprot:45592-Amorphochlora_amoeboformis.AAC.1
MISRDLRRTYVPRLSRQITVEIKRALPSLPPCSFPPQFPKKGRWIFEHVRMGDHEESPGWPLLFKAPGGESYEALRQVRRGSAHFFPNSACDYEHTWGLMILQEHVS